MAMYFFNATVYFNAVDIPKITRHPAVVSVGVGESVTFSVEAEGNELQYQWYFKIIYLKRNFKKAYSNLGVPYYPEIFALFGWCGNGLRIHSYPQKNVRWQDRKFSATAARCIEEV